MEKKKEKYDSITTKFKESVRADTIDRANHLKELLKKDREDKIKFE